jgi:hypothetical protein
MNDKEILRQKIESYPDDTTFYVQNGYCGNSICWWGLNSCGYTTNIEKAQLYTKEDILNYFLNKRECDVIWLASHVLEHITKTVNSQHLDEKFKM